MVSKEVQAYKQASRELPDKLGHISNILWSILRFR